MSKSPEEASKIGEVVTLTIEKINDADKSEIIANLFIEYTQNVLKSSELRRLTDIIDRVFIDDLLELVETHNIVKIVNHKCFLRLKNTDLVDSQPGEKIDDLGKQFYRLSKLGNKYINAYLHGMKLRQS